MPAAELGTPENAVGQGPPIGRNSSDPPAREVTAPGISRWIRWVSLLQRVLEIDALRCPRCGSKQRLIAAIEDPAVARKILECLKLAARAPPLDPGSASEPDLPRDDATGHFGQTPADDES